MLLLAVDLTLARAAYVCIQLLVIQERLCSSTPSRANQEPRLRRVVSYARSSMNDVGDGHSIEIPSVTGGV